MAQHKSKPSNDELLMAIDEYRTMIGTGKKISKRGLTTFLNNKGYQVSRRILDRPEIKQYLEENTSGPKMNSFSIRGFRTLNTIAFRDTHSSETQLMDGLRQLSEERDAMFDNICRMDRVIQDKHQEICELREENDALRRSAALADSYKKELNRITSELAALKREQSVFAEQIDKIIRYPWTNKEGITLVDFEDIRADTPEYANVDGLLIDSDGVVIENDEADIETSASNKGLVTSLDDALDLLDKEII